jgi:hypothetical protein
MAQADYTRFDADGSCASGAVHPEIAEASLACLKRDLRILRQCDGMPFLRRPYNDLHEAQMIALNPGSPQSGLIVGVGVFPVIKGDANARIPMTAEQIQSVISEGKLVDLWSIKNKGFGSAHDS